MENNKLFIFLHIPKCAGTTINYHIKFNFKEEEFLYISKGHGFYNLKTKAYEMLQDEERIKQYLSSLSEEDKRKIKIISGHNVFYGIHEFFDKDPLYITFLRDPFERTISQYNHYKKVINQIEESEDNIGKLKININSNEAKAEISSKESVLNFEEWIKSDLGPREVVIKGLVVRGFIEKKIFKEINKEDLINSLKKFYFIGLVEKSKEDMRYISHLFNFKNYYLDKNLSIQDNSVTAISKEKMNELKEIFLSKNRLDNELYEIALEKNKEFKESNTNFKKITKKEKIKRIFVLPITNTINIIKKKINL